MHPLSIFPNLLTYALLAPFLLRIAIGIVRLTGGIEKNKRKISIFSILQIISSIMLIIGLYTQLAVLVALLCVAIDYKKEAKKGEVSQEKKALAIVMSVVLLSLLFTGPGFFAFDLPL
jgi:uncharacterized membrane protein YphA (DoxX/SURF4 family)